MLDKPDLLIIGLDRLGIDLAMAASALGARVVLTMQGETGLEFARRDGEILMRLASTPAKGATELSHAYEQILNWIAVSRSPERLRAARVAVEPGHACFLDRKRVALGERVLTPRRIVIATGQVAKQPLPSFFEPNGDDIPKRVLISGNNAAGLALASIVLRGGSQTSLVTHSASLDTFDPEMLALCLAALERKGLSLLTEIPALRPAEIPVWPAPEFRPALDDLGLEKTGIKLRDGGLLLGSHLETSHSGVSAIGSVTGAAEAGMVGYLLARLMFRKFGRYNPPLAVRHIPTMPGLAEIGLSEKAARERSGPVSIHRASASETGPGGGGTGCVKLICDRKGKLLGGSILAADAIALASVLGLAIANDLKLESIANLSLPPGASAEALRLAASAPQRAQLRSPRLQRALRLMRRFG